MSAVPQPDLSVRVQAHLDAFAANQRRRLAAAGPRVDTMIDAALASATGGKRLRAAYCVQGWRAAGGDPGDERITVAAAALEWLQACALVHDDLIDASDTRRGRPSVHRAFEAEHRRAGWPGDEKGYGTGVAILVGDLMLSWTDEMFRSCGLPAERVSAALPYLDACRSEVVAGQFLDVAAQAAGETSLEVAMTVVRFKAAKYTVERPLHLGAVLAGADRALVEALTAVGLPAGEAFQLRDDVLGVFGDASVTGKPAGDDLREGKRTALLAHAYAGADEAGRSLLDTLVGDRGLRDEQVEQLRAVIRATGALDAVEAQIDALWAAAMAALAIAPVDDAARASLTRLVQRSIRRTS
ncbi:MAG: polyprenyl synthetase family protein [Actinomycetota bacterium]|nr:polyprenyl synthetase family protein [Actinomycetota bacterium]